MDARARGWDKSQVKTFVKDAIKRNSALWESVPKARVGIISHKFAGIVCGQHSETLSTEQLSTLWHDMLSEAGLLDDI